MAITRLTATPAVTASSAYASGNTVGAVMSFSLGTNNMMPQGEITRVLVFDTDKQTETFNLALFSAAPATPVANKAAFDIAAADIPLSQGYIAVATSSVLANVSMFTDANGPTALKSAFPFITSAGTLYAQLYLASGTPTYTTTSSIIVVIYINDLRE